MLDLVPAVVFVSYGSVKSGGMAEGWQSQGTDEARPALEITGSLPSRPLWPSQWSTPDSFQVSPSHHDKLPYWGCRTSGGLNALTRSASIGSIVYCLAAKRSPLLSPPDGHYSTILTWNRQAINYMSLQSGMLTTWKFPSSTGNPLLPFHPRLLSASRKVAYPTPASFYRHQTSQASSRRHRPSLDHVRRL